MKQSLVKIEENVYQRINKREFFPILQMEKKIPSVMYNDSEVLAYGT